MDEQVVDSGATNTSTKPSCHRLTFSVACGVLIGIVGLLAVWNYVSVGSKAAEVINRDTRNTDAGISISAHYAYYVDPTMIVFDVRDFKKASCLDMLRVLFSFAGEMRGHRYSRVVLEHNGAAKFFLVGSYFQTLGDGYAGGENPMYLIRTLPENVYFTSGNAAYGHWTGGWLGVLGKQMEDVNTFCGQWIDIAPPAPAE